MSPASNSYHYIHMICLELVHLILLVAEVLESTGQFALVLRAHLVSRDGLHQTGRTADEKLDVLVLGLRKDSLEEVLGDVALVADPLLGGVVEDVESAEALGVGVLEMLELLLEEDVLLGNVAKDECDLGLVVRVVEDGAGELVHRGNSGTAGNKGDVVVLVLLPGVLGERSLDVESLTGDKVVDVCAHGTIGVLLNKQVEETLLT